MAKIFVFEFLICIFYLLSFIYYLLLNCAQDFRNNQSGDNNRRE